MLLLPTSFFFFFGFWPLRPVTATQTYFHLSLPFANISPSRIPVFAKLFFILFIHLCFGLPSGLPWGFFLKPLLLNYLISIRDQPIRFFCIAVLLLCPVIYLTVVVIYCFLFHIFGWYHSFMVQIFFLVFFFLGLLFCLHLFWLSTMSYRHIEELAW